MIWLGILLALQPAPTQRAEPFPAPWPNPEREMPSGEIMAREADAGEARRTMIRYAACVAERSPGKVHELLVQDFRTTSYRNGLRNLSRNNEGCARSAGLRGTLRMDSLPFAAALAEEMIRRGEEPLNVRLAKAATGQRVETYAPSDAIAMCVARSAPDDVAGFMQTAPGSREEAAAATTVMGVANLCSRDAKIDIGPEGLRAIVATAAYRLLAAQGEGA